MNQFEYIFPKTKEEVLKILKQEKSKACIVAGCSNILPYIKDKIISEKLLLDISGIEELNYIKKSESEIFIGANTTISDLINSRIIREECNVLYQAAEEFADPTVRNRATIGGNLADASPAADTAPPLLILDAVLEAESMNKKREIPLKDFFVGPRKTVLHDDEMIINIKIKNNSINKNGTFIKLGLRQAMAISLATIALSLEMEKDKVTDVRIAMGSIAPIPLRLFNTEEFLKNKGINDGLIDKIMQKIREEVKPIGDVRASAEYRRYVSGILFRRAFNKLTNSPIIQLAN
ncbi:MAG: xanthine dehydrogenase family protein subunit M [Candidatus Caldatribacteriota bacterium]|nr:xanthine dehydrogenase family protein subunit M [Candidatus Caldatribacteriota bacterium]